MYKLIYETKNKKECLGSYTDIEMAIEEMDRLQRESLGQDGMFQIMREGYEREKQW